MTDLAQVAEAADIQDLVRRAVVAKLVADEARGMTDKVVTLAALTAAGARTVDAIGPDGTVYGTVSRCSGRKEARVTDRDAFWMWVLERHPEWIVRLIDPDREKQLLSLMTKLGSTVEPGTGEVVPGVTIETGSPYISVRSSEDGRDLMRQVLDPQRGDLFALPERPEATTPE